MSSLLVTVDGWWRQLIGWSMMTTRRRSSFHVELIAVPCEWAGRCSVSTISPRATHTAFAAIRRHRSSIGWLRDAQITYIQPTAQKRLLRSWHAAVSDASRGSTHQASSLTLSPYHYRSQAAILLNKVIDTNILFHPQLQECTVCPHVHQERRYLCRCLFPFTVTMFSCRGRNNKKLVRRLVSDRELFLRRHLQSLLRIAQQKLPNSVK